MVLFVSCRKSVKRPLSDGAGGSKPMTGIKKKRRQLIVIPKDEYSDDMESKPTSTVGECENEFQSTLLSMHIYQWLSARLPYLHC